ncbi:hypothetical protein [Aeoliella sp.]|uniref:hypothetical protein n=1 Tax=Aeoliella sp. TaxID=2795800 RepID=UPI003CCBE53B
MRGLQNEKKGLEQRLQEIRRSWSPQVYRRRRRNAATLQGTLVELVLRPIPRATTIL